MNTKIKYLSFVLMLFATLCLKAQCPDTLIICSNGDNLFQLDLDPTLTYSLRLYYTNNYRDSDPLSPMGEGIFRYNENVPFWFVDGEYEIINVQTGEIVCQGIYVVESCVDHVWFENHYHCVNDGILECADQLDIDNYSYILHRHCLGDTTNLHIYTNDFDTYYSHQPFSPERVYFNLGHIVDFNDREFRVVWDKTGEECMELETTTLYGDKFISYRAFLVHPSDSIIIEDRITNLRYADICEGESIELNIRANGNIYPIWNISDGRRLTGFNNTIKFDEPGTYTINVSAEDLGYPSPGNEEFSPECDCTKPGEFIVTVTEGDKPSILCKRTVCVGESTSYFAESECENYYWDVGPGGTVISGGTINDSYIEIQWNQGEENEITLYTPDCFENSCSEEVTEIINVIDPDASIDGVEIVCSGEIETYSVPNFTGTNFDWANPDHGYIINGYGANTIQVLWDSDNQVVDTELEVEYYNCNLGCQGSARIPIRIRPKLILEINNAKQCLDTDFSVTNNLGINLDWALVHPDGQIDSFFARPNLDLNLSAPGIYFINGMNPNDNSCNRNVFLEFEILEQIEAPLFINGPENICSGKEIKYTIDNLGSFQSVTWFVRDGSEAEEIIGPERELIFEWSSNGPYELGAQIVDLFSGCESEITWRNLDQDREIQGPDALCVGETFQYTIPDTDGEEINWIITPSTNVEIVNQNQDYIFLKWNAIGSYTLSASFCNKTINSVIEVNSYPSMTINYDDRICFGETTELNIATDPSNTIRILRGNSLIGSTNSTELFAGNYQIEVINPAGCEITEEIQITEFDVPEFTINASARTYCPETSTSFLFIQNPLPGYSYEWYHNGNPLGISDISFETTDVGLFYVIAEDPNGCTRQTDAILLERCCFGNNGEPYDPVVVQLDANAVNCTTYDFSVLQPYESTDFIWNFGDPQSGNNIGYGTETSHVFSGPGYYTVTVNGNEVCTTVLADQCGVEVEIERCEEGAIEVVIPVVAEFEFTTGCIGEQTQFFDTSPKLPGVTGLQYQWIFGDSTSPTNESTSINPSHVYNSSGRYTVQLTITHSSGCTTTATRIIDIVDLNTAAIVGDDKLCLGEVAQFSASSSCANCNYTWNFDDPNSGLENFSKLSNPSHTFSKDGNYNVSLIIASEDGCSTTEQWLIEIVNNDMAGDITSSTGNNRKCPGEELTLNAPMVGVEYQWSTGETSTSILVSEEATYDVTITNDAGCSYSPVGFKVFDFYDSKVKIFADVPTRGFVYDSLTVCEGERFGLFVSEIPNGNYQWSPISSTDIYLPYNVHFRTLSPGEYYYTVSALDQVNNCSVASDSFKLTILPSLDNPEISSGGIFRCENDEVEIIVENYDSTLNYDWSNGESGRSIIVNSPGTYNVTVSNNNTCSRPSSAVYLLENPPINEWMTGCMEVCFPREICVNLRSYYNYELIRNDSVIMPVNSSSDLLELTEPGSYQLRATDNYGCQTISDPLNLTAMSENHTLDGLVFKDENDNSIYDAGDRLLENVTMYLMVGNTVLEETTTDSLGMYSFDNLGLGNVRVVLDTSSVNFLFDEETEFDLVYSECVEHKRIDFPLYSTCNFPISSETYYTCPGEPVFIHGRDYYEYESDSLTFNLFEDCDSTLIIDILPYDDPELEFEYTNSCTAVENGSIVIHNLLNDSLRYELNGVELNEDSLFTDLSPGEYILYVYNAADCAFEHEFEIEEINVPTLEIETFNTCANMLEGSVSFEATNNSALLYKLDIDSSYSSESTIEGLSSGIYTIYYADSLGCEYQDVFEIEDFNEVELNFVTEHSCENYNNGSINIELLSGVPEFSLDDQNYSQDQAFYNLDAGSYKLYYVSEYGCKDSLEFEIPLVEMPEIEISIQPECENNELGYFNIMSNTDELEYSINGVDFIEDDLFENLEAGNYTLLFRTIEGCEYEQSFEVTELPQPDISIQTTISCEEENNGTSTVTEGSGLDFEISYDGINYGEELYQNNLAPGTYQLFIQNELGCVYKYDYAVDEVTNPVLEYEWDNTCVNSNSGTIEILSLEAGQEFSLNNSTYSTQSFFDDLSEGTYNLLVQDSNGCSTEAMVTIESNPPLIVDASSYEQDCYKESVVIEPDVQSHFGNLEYRWSNGSNASSVVASKAGLYAVTITDDCDSKVLDIDLNIQIIDEERSFYQPNIFLMKNNDENGCFRIYPDPELLIISYEFDIFDRWGELMFSTTDTEACWNGIFHGDYVEQGVYVYIMRAVIQHCDEIELIKKVGDLTVVD